MATENDSDLYTRMAIASSVFTPAAPINKLGLFRGRKEQISKVFEAINQVGEHVVIYGERGVGKTSLASVIGEILDDARMVNVKLSQINCDIGDTFGSLWRKVFGNLYVPNGEVRDDSAPERSLELPNSLAEWLGDNPTPEDVRKVAQLAQGHLIAIIDEYDQLKGRAEIASLMANTMKNLSDHRAGVTLILVGVADSIDDLVTGHLSAERGLRQVQLPRMSGDEIGQIIRGGLAELSMTIDDDALAYTQALVQGLPSPAHRIGLRCAYTLINEDRSMCTKTDIHDGLGGVLESLPESMQLAWDAATRSPRPEALFNQVLVACALTPRDDLGWFFPSNVREAFRAVTRREDYDIGGYSQHLHLLATGRGNVLERTGNPRKYRFRFTNPLFQAYVVMRALNEGLLTKETLDRFRKNLPG
ncbi:MAG: AAA family ATPase [Dehalococcoidia bacterium]|jgi:energy-coupling factor transporter ATP-binding protein EcfA2